MAVSCSLLVFVSPIPFVLPKLNDCYVEIAVEVAEAVFSLAPCPAGSQEAILNCKAGWRLSRWTSPMMPCL